MDRDKVLTPRVVEGLIAQGAVIVIFEEYVLRLDGWLDKHPGGRLAILHMVGRDATDEILAYHSAATAKTMKAYRIGRKPPGVWANMTPPIRGGHFRPLPCHPDSTSSLDEAAAAAVRQGDTGLVHDAAAGRDDDLERRRGPARAMPLMRAGPAAFSTGCRDQSPLDPAAAGTPRQRRSPFRSVDNTDDDDNDDEKDERGQAAAQDSQHVYRTMYIEWAVQQGVQQCLENYPSLDTAVQQDIVRRYRALHQQVIDERLYECRFREYAKELVRYLTLFALFLFFLRKGWYTTSAVFLGLFWIMFTAHDAGHRAISQNFVVDTLLGMFIADFCCGLSIGWWKSSHNVHHLVTNNPEHDPDIQNIPLFATCPDFFRSVYSTYYGFSFVWDGVAELLVPLQKYTYYPVMAIARFNLYLLSWLHILSARSSLGSSKAWWIRPTEIAFMAGYWLLFGYALLWRTLPTWHARLLFVLVSHLVTMPLHVQITLSHWGMSTADLGEAESFAQRQLRTTLDVDCPRWLDFLHGGLQFQSAHHLFPRLPRHNLRRAQELCLRFSADTGIPYSILGFVNGNRKVLGRLDEVAEQVKILVRCQKYMAETGESGLH